MSQELFAIIGAAIAIIGLVLRSQGRITARLDNLAERVARIEGILTAMPETAGTAPSHGANRP